MYYTIPHITFGKGKIIAAVKRSVAVRGSQWKYSAYYDECHYRLVQTRGKHQWLTIIYGLLVIMMLIQVHQLKQNVITLVVDVGNRAMYVVWV